MATKPNIGVVGAGIGGVALALALQKHGNAVTLYEQASELGEIGAGITVGPNAGRILAALGLDEALESLASATASVGTLHYQTGERLAYVERGREQYLRLYGAVTRHLHRADLHGVLVGALERPEETLKLNYQLKEISQDASEVELTFAHGGKATCDVLIACDGLKSLVRDQVFETGAPEFTGYVAWRGLVDQRDVPNLPLDPQFASFPAVDRLFARYPVRNGELINYVAVARKQGFQSESWKAEADVDEVLLEFENWHDDVIRVIRATPAQKCSRWALHTRQPLDSWINGRIALLGDAAHPMTPFLGMGAAMAIEDAAVLARSFAISEADWASGLRRYERARLPRANKIHQHSIERGEASLGVDPKQRNQAPGAGLDEIYRYDAMTVAI